MSDLKASPECGVDMEGHRIRPPCGGKGLQAPDVVSDRVDVCNVIAFTYDS
jgi:hypothetical protein